MLTKSMLKKSFEIECDICGAISTCNINDLICKNPDCGYHLKPKDDSLISLFGKAVQVLDSTFSYQLFDPSVLPVNQMAATIIDESKWNWRYDSINQIWITPDYDKFKTTDGLFIIKKASQGLWDDPTWEPGVGLILNRDIALGGYHYADVYFNAAQSARKFSTQAKAIPQEFIWGTATFPQWWLDCENNKGNGSVPLSPSQMASYIYTFVQEFQGQTGYPIGIYTREIWWNDYVARNSWANKLALWIARYNGSISEPGEPKDWSNYGKKPMLWQWSADGNGKGFQYGYLSNSIDMNRSPLLTNQQVLDIVYYDGGTPPPQVGLPYELNISDPSTGEAKLYRQVQ